MKKREGFTREELIQVVARLSAHLQKQELHIPVSIFASTLSPAEVLVKYLKEQKQLRYSNIAKLLNRDQRGIWCTYKRANNKHPKKLVVTDSKHAVPVSLFTNRKLSILEHTVDHLRKQKITVKKIAKLIDKSPSTIAVVHHRVRRKLQ